jgi:REP element-mobilizing transposase RayT
MEPDSTKEMYLKSTIIGLKHKSSNGHVMLQAFCVMSNHSHQILKYSGGVDFLSRFMRIAHREFGRIFNKTFKRSGKVANERPRTVVVQETDHSQMRAHMYVEANPIRAGMKKFENLKLYRFSSFRFYAFGILDEFTKILVPPNWYIRLGRTPEERQRKYRSLFQAYLSQDKAEPKNYLIRFICELIWCQQQMGKIHDFVKNTRAGPDSLEIIEH